MVQHPYLRASVPPGVSSHACSRGAYCAAFLLINIGQVDMLVIPGYMHETPRVAKKDEVTRSLHVL